MKMAAKRKEIITHCTRENKPVTEKTTAMVFGNYGYHRRTDFWRGKRPDPESYVVTHIPSGLKASGGFISCTQARALAYDLAQLTTRWHGQGTAPDDFIQAVKEANNKI